MYSFSFTIRRTHPSLKGHFPGNPIVPGAVILDKVISGMLSKDPTINIISIPSVKFLKFIRPQEKILVTLSRHKSDVIQFTCSNNDSINVSGRIIVDPTGEI